MKLNAKSEQRRRRVGIATLAAAITCCVAVAAAGSAGAASNTIGKTTVQQRIVAAPGSGYRTLQLGPGEPYVVRQDGIGTAKTARASRRRSLVYFSQLSDFQLADEESPARVEFIDALGPPVDAAWRPWEALEPQIDDQAIRQVNAFAAASPIAQGNGKRRPMDFSIDTGDSADSMQLNETQWVRTLLEGGTLNPNSGVSPVGYLHPLCPPALVPGATEAAGYTGVQDYNDYFEGPFPAFYDPNTPRGAWSSFPRYSGLMGVAQQPFQAAGLSVPSYVVFGNHDGLVQGNQASNSAIEQVATGCIKVTAPIGDPRTLQEALNTLNPTDLLATLTSDPSKVALVPPDPKRQAVSKAQYKNVFLSGTQADGHGFGYVDPAQNAASHGAAGYYSWSPVPGFRFIGLDTLSEGGITGPSADGNLDDPQFQWLQGQLQQATAQNQLVVIFSHHAPESLTANVPDEAAPPCTGNEPGGITGYPHGHDINPGCDVDPRSSQPIHLESDVVSLLHQYPHVIAWVAGHSHENKIDAFPNPSGTGGFWSIRVAAEADWPQQARLLEVFDNKDGTLSIFGTIIDHASGATAAPSGTPATALDPAGLASVGRTLSYNDRQVGAPHGEGTTGDRNVELLVADPR